MRKNKFVWVLITALLSSMAVVVTPTAAIAETVTSSKLIESFEAGGPKWLPERGKVTVSSSTVQKTEGLQSLEVSYDVTGGDSYLTTEKTPVPIASNIYSSMTFDLKGDGTWNTVYAMIRDGSGEIYYYRIDAMGYTNWKTVTVDLTKAPTNVSHGNTNSVLDAPLSLYKLMVVRNGNQPAVGKFNIDNIRTVDNGWTVPTAVNPDNAKNFVPSTGQTTTVSFNAGTPGDYSLELKDATGLTKTFKGKVDVAKKVSTVWNGKSDSGVLLGGNINSILKYDTVADGTLTVPAVTGGNPFMTGVAARKKSPVDYPVGINGSLANTTIPLANSQAKLMEDAYVNYTRENFEWKILEPSKNQFMWGQTDQAVAAANARNINVMGRLLYTAPWASSAPAGTPAADLPYYPPANLKDYTDYVTETVHRYKGSVKTWEVWNEVNTSFYWKPGPDAAAYAEMLKAAYTAIKAEDPTATVVAAGLAGFDFNYMETFRAAGGMQYFDALGVHTFVDKTPDAGMGGTWLDGAESYLAKYAPGKKIWVTEVAWSTCAPTEASCNIPVTEEQQAQYLYQSYIDAAQRGISSIMWWNMIEFGNSTNLLDNYGVVEQNGRQKPAYQALKAVGKAMYGSIAVGSTSPTADGKSTIINPMDTMTAWKAYSINGGASTIAVDKTRKHSTTGSAALTYNFSGTSKGVELQTTAKVAGEPTALSIWSYGDKSNNPIYIKFQDSAGEYFQGVAGGATTETWKRLTLYMDGSGQDYNSWGGDDDNVVDYPITVKSVFVYKSLLTKQETGKIYLDDLSAHYGPITRGVVMNSRDIQSQLLYSAGTTTVNVTVPNSAAEVSKVDGTKTVLPNNASTVPVPLSPMPVAVTYSLGVSPATSSLATPVTLTWQAGDRSKTAIQIYAKNGTHVRTLKSTQNFDSGLKTEIWDGKTANGTVAPAGEYKFRVTFFDTNNQSTFSEKVFVKTP